MSEENAISRIRISYDEYILKTDREITALKNERTLFLHKLAFFMFEYNLIKGSLPDNIKKVFDEQNSDSSRLEEIMDLKDLNTDYDNLPIEIKLLIKDVLL